MNVRWDIASVMHGWCCSSSWKEAASKFFQLFQACNVPHCTDTVFKPSFAQMFSVFSPLLTIYCMLYADTGAPIHSFPFHLSTPAFAMMYRTSARCRKVLPEKTRGQGRKKKVRCTSPPSLIPHLHPLPILAMQTLLMGVTHPLFFSPRNVKKKNQPAGHLIAMHLSFEAQNSDQNPLETFCKV